MDEPFAGGAGGEERVSQEKLKQLLNANPIVFKVHRETRSESLNEDVREPFDALEIFDLLRDIKDPVWPLLCPWFSAEI